MSAILARNDPLWEVAHDDLLVTVPGLAALVQDFNTLNWAGKMKFIEVVKSSSSSKFLPVFF